MKIIKLNLKKKIAELLDGGLINRSSYTLLYIANRNFQQKDIIREE